MSDRTDVFACEPQPIVVEALQRILGESAQFTLVGASPVLSDALEAIRHVRPHVLLIDESYGIPSTVQFLAEVRAVSPGSRAVLWATGQQPDDWIHALQIGARGVLHKTLPVSALFQCLRAVGAGHWWMGDQVQHQTSALSVCGAGPRLTPREIEVVRCVIRGLRNREIAAELGISQGTVKVHLMHVFEKTGVKDRFELAAEGGRLLASGRLAG